MSIEELSLEGAEHEELYKAPHDIEREAEVIDGHIPPPDPCISFGTYQYRGLPEPIVFGSYGDITCLVGESKSMKSRLKSAIVACFIGDVKQRFSGWQSHKAKEKWCIELDTEQSEFHVARMRENTREMGWAKSAQNYKTFRLRKYSPIERRKFLEYICLESRYADNLGLVVVDGAADLVTDTNDLVESQKLVNLFMRITDETNCHLLTILHRTKSSKKPTGHIGSSILKKSETVLILDRTENTVTVSADYTRGYPIDTFKFTLDSDFLPISEDMNDNPFED